LIHEEHGSPTAVDVLASDFEEAKVINGLLGSDEQ